MASTTSVASEPPRDATVGARASLLARLRRSWPSIVLLAVGIGITAFLAVGGGGYELPDYFAVGFMAAIIVHWRHGLDPVAGRVARLWRRVAARFREFDRALNGVPANLARPIVQIVQTGLPIAFVVLAFFFFVTAGFAPWVQVVLGAVTWIVGWLLFGLERRDATIVDKLWHDKRVVLWFLGGLVAAIFVLGAVAAALVGLFTTGVDTYDRLGGTPTLVAALAVVAVILLLLVRLGAFAKSKLKFLAAALVALWWFQLAAEFGLFWGYPVANAVPLYVLPGVILAIALPLVGFAHDGNPALERPVMSKTRRAAVNGYAFAGVVIASVVFFLAVCTGALTAGGSSASYGGLKIRPGQPSEPLTTQALDDHALAWSYAPVLQYDRQENWHAVDVRSYLPDVVTEPGGRQVDQDTLAASCSSGTVRCKITCKLGNGKCADPRYPPGYPAGLSIEGAEYAHVIRVTNPLQQHIFRVPNPYGKALVAIVEYWLFYRFDDWRATTIAGILDQRHEADWEAVTVGLSKNGPLFAAYSQHCGGRWYPWGRIEAAGTPGPNRQWAKLGRGLHPLVAVGEGSHANYLDSWTGRAPPWGGCRKISSATVDSISYAWNLRDRTGDWATQIPAEVLVVDKNTPPMSYGGLWGENETITLDNLRRPRLVIETGDAPESPPNHALWKDPLRTIFHNAQWERG